MNIASDGKIFDTNPEPLADLLKGIHEHKVALPDFQRPWIWEPEMVHSLIISVAYRYPAGSLLTMPVTDKGFALRPFEGSGSRLSGHPSLMILDGQQRLTSLYQALFSREGVQHKQRRYHFYLDVPVLLSDEDGSIDVGVPLFEEALFYVTEQKKTHKRVRYVDLQPKYDISTPDDELAAGTLPLWTVFDSDDALSKWRDDYLLRQLGDEAPVSAYKDQVNRWDKLVRPWVERIRSYPFPVVRLHENMPLGAICHIFEKVNSTGVPLNVFDLSNAILWAQEFLLNREWERLTKERLQRLFPMQRLDGTYFLQGIALLDSWHRKYVTKEADAVLCRKQDLMRLSADTVRRWWEVLADGYVEAAKFMSEQGIIHDRILPYSTMIAPLGAIFAHLRQRRPEAGIGPTWEKVSQWYWCSVFTQRYSGQLETRAAQDFEQVIAWLKNGDEPNCVRTFTFRSDALQEITSIRNVIYKGVLCLLARDGARDFGGGARLNTELAFDTSQDHHHIFPTEALRKLGVQDARSDSIVNKTLISASVNRKIGGRPPSSYCETLARDLDAEHPEKLDAILESHRIPAAQLRADDWTGFIDRRREQLRQLIEQACGKPTQPFSDDLSELEIEESNGAGNE